MRFASKLLKNSYYAFDHSTPTQAEEEYVGEGQPRSSTESATPGGDPWYPTASSKKAEDGYEAESKEIRWNKDKPYARKPHEFEAAKWTYPNGHPRCKWCGDEEAVGGMCPGLDKAKKAAHGNRPDGHLNNVCPRCEGHSQCKCMRAHHSQFPGGVVPETRELCYECANKTSALLKRGYGFDQSGVVQDGKQDNIDDVSNPTRNPGKVDVNMQNTTNDPTLQREEMAELYAAKDFLNPHCP